MTRDETLKVLGILSAFYGQGKSDARMMASAWHALLKEYPYIVAERAVMKYAKHDKREYASFPPPGVICNAIEAEQKVLYGVRNKALKKAEYQELDTTAREWVTEPLYEWMMQQSEDALLNDFDTLKTKIWDKHAPALSDGK